MERRRQAGRAVDGHGDLHLQHIWFESPEAPPQVIDCLEFSEDLRRIDAASELAFLAMDLGYRQRVDLAESLLADYAGAADDYDLYGVVDFFMSYRAAVRGKVAALTARDSAVASLQRERAAGSAERHIDFAIRALRTPKTSSVYLVGGLVGTGKSTAARVIAAEIGAVILSSDRIRRRLLGEPDQKVSWREGRYAESAALRVYDALFERAAPVTESGRTVILDASWSRRDLRERARAFAAERKARCLFVEVRCSRLLALTRLAQRQREGRDPSEAGPELYDRFAASFEALEAGIEWPARDHWVIDTEGADWRGALARQLASAPP
jgi:predicted kinase